MKRLLYIVCLAVVAAVCAAVAVSCGTDGARTAAVHGVPLDSLLAGRGANAYDSHLDSAPDYGCVKLKLRHIGPLRRAFRDSNYLHVAAGELMGIEPIRTLDDAWRNAGKLVEIRSCREYFVDNLTHSYPYLTEEGAELLGEIGRRFNDTLASRGGGNYRIKVTSVLRTAATVRSLRRINVNATDASSHQYATTFDISYSKFVCDSPGVNRTFEDLKNLLGEILYGLREEGRCYVVFERKQSCFHVTARPRDHEEDEA